MKAFFFEKKKQKTFVRCRGRVTSARQRHKSFLLLFFKKEGLFLFLSFPFTALAQPTHDTCVDVQVGTAQSYACLNQKLQAVARDAQKDSAAANAPYNANSPSNVTGQFNEDATRERLGTNFGKSVTPQRPAVNYPQAFARPH